MKRLMFFLFPFLAIAPLACGPTEGEIRRAITEGIQNATQERVLDLGYKLGQWISGSTEITTVTRYYRAVEGSALQEQRGFDAQGDQEVRTTESQSLRKRTEHILGRELRKEILSDDLDIAYHTWVYYADVTETNLWTTSTTTTKIGVNTDVDKTESFSTTRRGILAYWLEINNDFREISSVGVPGMFDIGLLNVYGIPADIPILLGKKDPQLGEIFFVPASLLGSTLYRVVGTETATLTIDGQSQSVQATKIEVKAFVASGEDPDQAYLKNCLETFHQELESVGVTNTTITAFNCPAQIFTATVLWYQNFPILFQGTVADVTLEPINNSRTAFQGGTSFRRNDPGYGYELIESCDPISGDANSTTVTCRFFSIVDDGQVCIDTQNPPCGPNEASVDFRQRRSQLKKYAHFSLNRSQVLFRVTEIRNEPLK